MTCNNFQHYNQTKSIASYKQVQILKMFHDQMSNNRTNPRAKGRVSTRMIDPNVLKPLLQLVDQGTFQENLNQLQQQISLPKLDPQSQTFKDLKHYLKVLLRYPNRSLAELHRHSHRLGNFDVQILNSHYQANYDQNQHSLVQQLQNCPCCGLRKQEQQLKICSIDFQNMEMLGISTYMFFRTMRNLIYFLILALIVFGVYSFVSNIHTSNIWRDKGRQDLFSNTILISLGSKIYLAMTDDSTQYLIGQVWVGFAFVVLLMLAYLWMQHIQVEEIQEIMAKTRTVADYSIVLKGVPTGITKEQIEKNLNLLCGLDNQFHTQGNLQPQKLRVVKINTATPIYIQSKLRKRQKSQLKQIDISINEFRQIIISWIKQLTVSKEFQTPPQQRKKIENQYLKKLTQRNNSVKEIVNKIKAVYQDPSKSRKNLTYCFVTLESTKQKQKILKVIENNPVDKFLEYASLSFYQKIKKMTFGPLNEEYDVEIHQAEEPQDVLWQNIGLSTKKLFIRKCITLASTILVLGASFGVVYGLSTVQAKNQSNQYISFLISIVIVIFNVIINIVLRLFTSFEKNTSYTAYESSYAFKSILAQMVNTIIIPILVNRFLKQENYLYTKSGLAEDIFLLGLTNAFISPLLKFVDIEYLFRKYFLVWYYSRPVIEQKFRIDQIELNKLYELMFFENGLQYIYVITLYLWTCFFMPLQPIVIAFSIAGFLMNYWAQKYSLFHRCKRPVPGTRKLYNVMVQFVYAGGLFYALGSLTFINFLPKDVLNTDPKFVLVANILSAVFGALSLFIPYSYIYNRWLDNKQETPDCLYEKQRILFPSQYDRVNPVTSDRAIEQYIAYVNKKKQEIQKKLGENKLDAEMTQLFAKLSQKGRNIYTLTQREMNPYLKSFGGALSNLFAPQIESINPSQIESYLLTDLFENVSKPSQEIEINDEKSKIYCPIEKQFFKKSGDDNIVKSAFRKALATFQNQQQNKMNAQNPQNQYSLERLANDDLMLDDGKTRDQQRQNTQNVQSQVKINISGNVWQTLAAGIRQQIPQHENPIINPLNYATSPYNPSSLQAFKLQTNTGYSINRLQSQTGQSYKNINEAVRMAKRSLKQIPHQ